MIAKVISVLVISMCFSIVLGVRGKHILFAGLAGGLGYLAYLLAGPLGALPSTLISSATVAAASEAAARIRKAPATLFLVSGLIPLVPGGRVYEGAFLAMTGNPAEAAMTFYNAFLETAAIAVGVILVSSLVRLFLTGLDWRIHPKDSGSQDG